MANLEKHKIKCPFCNMFNVLYFGMLGAWHRDKGIICNHYEDHCKNPWGDFKIRFRDADKIEWSM